MKWLLQKGDVCFDEKRAVRNNSNSYGFSSFDELDASSNGIPVGSVEFCKRLMALKGIPVPSHLSYPYSLCSYLGRALHVIPYRDVGAGMFVKPYSEIKAFTGHLKGCDYEKLYGEPLPDIQDIQVYVSEPISIESEWRYYIIDGEIVGLSRYDDGEDDAPEPDRATIVSCIEDFKNAPIGYALDFGVTDGRSVLIEANDGWALGYYRWGNMTEHSYCNLLEARWKQMSK